MTAFSKHVHASLRHKHYLVHTGPCLINALHAIPLYILSTMKYCLPFALIPLILKIKKRECDKSITKETLKHFVRMVLTLFTLGYSIKHTVCLYRYLFGDFYYGFIHLPSLTGFLVMWGLWPVEKNIAMTVMSQAGFDTYIQRSMLNNSRIVQTILFMISSGLIMCGKHNKMLSEIWLLSPLTKSTIQSADADEQKHTKCKHRLSCRTHLFKQISTYFNIGLLLDLLRMCVVKTSTHVNGILPKIMTKLRNFRPHSMLFLPSYVGIFELMLCLLNSHMQSAISTDTNHFLAGLLAGGAFIFNQKTALLSYGVLLSSEFLWCALKNQSKRLGFLHKVHARHILSAIMLVYICVTYFYDHRNVSPLAAKVINMSTYNECKQVSLNIDANMVLQFIKSLNIAKL